MSKMWIVAKREYLHNLRKPSFLFAAIGTPLFIVGIFAIVMLTIPGGADDDIITRLNANDYHVGYVDEAGVIAPDIAAQDLPEEHVPYPDMFIAYPDENAARADLDDNTIHAYIVISSDYMQSGMVELYSYTSTLWESLRPYVTGLLLANVSQGLDTSVPIDRITNLTGEEGMMVYVEDTGRELSPNAAPALLLMPIIFAVLFTLASQITSGSMMSGLVEEKTNRIMEILITSVTPLQLLAGKVIGLGALGLTQLVIWIALAGLVFVFGADLDFLEGVVFPVDLITVAVVYFILGYFLTSAIMAGIGAVVGSEQESRQYAGIISLVLFAPYFFMVTFLTNPDGPIAVGLSMFPLTSPMAMIMRYGLGSVSNVELAFSLGILLISTVFVTWLSARMFRWGLLMVGQKFSPRDILRVIRSRTDMGTVATQPQSAGKEA